MTDYDSNPTPLTQLPLRKFEHFRVSRKDAPPVRLDDTTISSSTNNNIACAVCHQHASRYTCPRCEIPYCSISCYQSHNNNSNNEQYSCTEGFYQDRVQAVVQLEQKAKQQDTLDLLNRTYQNSLNINDNEQDDEDAVETTELLELLSLLEENAEDDDNQLQQLSSFLSKSPKLKAAFEAALEKGEIQKLVLRPWDPWWRPILSIATNDGITNPPPEERKLAKTLDERLLQVKPFHSLLPKGARTIPNLQYNLIDVLYSIAKTLRLYHGVQNITSCKETSMEAAQTVLQESFVLNQDARYECVEEALMRRVNNIAMKDTGDEPHWTILAEDVALLVANKRFVGRALLEAMDIFKAAIAGAKLNNNTVSQASEWRRRRKKLEFFLSWMQSDVVTAVDPQSLAESIRAFVQHWNLDTGAPEKQQAAEGSRLQVVESLLDNETSKADSRATATDAPRRRGLIEELD